MRVVETFGAARAASWGTVALVPTMGFLHEGHLSLIEAARGSADTVIVSVFVNPLQFGEAADLDAYPRDLDRDLELCRLAGVDLVFAPAVSEVYAREPDTAVVPGSVADGMEGAHRPGHFVGVATVVTKLLAGLQPDRAHFGRKDAQQLAVIRTLVRDVSLPVEIVPGSTVREPDGLALSSRNVRIADRESALSLSRGLFAAADLAEGGTTASDDLVSAVRDQLPGAEYVAVVDAGSMAPLPAVVGEAVLATAARVGDVRLIDNVAMTAGDEGIAVDRGTRLDGPSILYN